MVTPKKEARTSSSDPSRSLRGTNTDFSRLYKAGAVLCYLFAVLPFCEMFTIPTIRSVFGQAVVMLLYLAFGLFGYAAQMLGGRLLHIGRKPEVYSYEDRTKRYRIEYAAVCHVGAVLVYLMMLFLSRHLFSGWFEYDTQDSVFPYILAVFSFVMTELGGYLWFIPYNTLISMRRIGFIGFVLLCIFILHRMLGLQGISPVDTAVHALSLVCVIILFVLLLNQAFITRPYGGKIARGINDAAKVYSARIVGIALGFVGVASVFTMSVIVAVVNIWYAILKFFLAQMKSRSAGGDMDAVKEVMDQDPAGEVLEMTYRQMDSWELVFGILAVISILCMIPAVRTSLITLWKRLKEILSFFLHPDRTHRQMQQKRENLNFVDVEEKTRKATHAAARRAETCQSYAAFTRRLDGFQTLDEKIRFAYAVAAVQLRHKNCGVRASDTPREIAGKVKRHGLIEDIDSLTADFERLQYENKTLGHAGEETLARLCAIIRTCM